MTSQEQFLNMLSSDIPLGYDVETNGLKWQSMYVCGYSLSDGKDAVYVPTRHEPGGNIDNVEQFEQQVAVAVQKRTAPLVGWNLKFDRHFSQNHGIMLPQNCVDAMIYEALLNEFRMSYSLGNVAKSYPSVPAKKEKELYEHIGKQFNIPPTRNSMGSFYKLRGDDPIACDYAKGDTLTTIGIYNLQVREIYGQDLEYVADLETKLSTVLQKMERRGIKIDMERLEKLKEDITVLRYEADLKIPLKEDLDTVNIRSSKDLQDYFTGHGITDWPLTEKGNPSFVASFLKTSDPGEHILQAKKLAHFESSFLDPIHDYIHNGRIYTNFNQTMSERGGTKSGRLSSFAYNAQQIPKRDEFLGKLFRAIFVSDPGFTFVEFDYSQCEPRLYSHYANETVLKEGYNATPFVDMHSIAAKYMGIDRKVAKNLNLGLLYVMGITKLAESLGISYDQARAISNKWHRTFPNVSAFTKKAAKRAEERGFVKTILGRRARFPDPRFSYKAANRIIQGGSADILKYKMIQLDKYITDNNLEGEIHMLLNIHDALLFQIRDDKVAEHSKMIASIMEDVRSEPFNLSIPFVADYPHSGKDWKEATYGH